MKELISILQEKIEEAFEKSGYEKKYGKVINSNRPDLCEFQCDGALTAAKQYKKAPFIIADEVVANCKDCKEFESIEVVKPGFININVSKEFLTNYCNNLLDDKKFGCEMENDKTVVIDYGGPNVAKPLHVGHLRPAIIGESVKRIHKFFENKTIGDVHLGDWGLQMGLVIEELEVRHPDWDYFNPDFEGEYPKEALFTVADLEEIYPAASAKTKVGENATEEEIEKANEYKEKARLYTAYLQEKRKGYYDLWKKIVEISVNDLKENYKKLDVDFDLWLGESDSQIYVNPMVEKMKELGIIYESDGAMVVDVEEPEDTTKINPCMVLKTGGVSCYQTTDLATIMQREKDFKPNAIIYVVDKRQELHFVQVFRCARKAQIINKDADLIFLGFGTMKGKDGKPFKTRAGGVMNLTDLMEMVKEITASKLNMELVKEEDKDETSEKISIAALKYADFLPYRSKDFIFDVTKFADLDGKTGPYLLYSTVRMNSLLEKSGIELDDKKIEKILGVEKETVRILLELPNILKNSIESKSLNEIADYLYRLTSSYNKFYAENHILTCKDDNLKETWLVLTKLVKDTNLLLLNILAIEVPEKM